MKRREFTRLAILFGAASMTLPSQARGLAEYDLYGKYIYAHSHEEGRDEFYYELKAGHVATYRGKLSEDPAIEKAGNWQWDIVKNTITVTFPRGQVFVFTIVGRDLKCIREPKFSKGYKGFAGALFKKS